MRCTWPYPQLLRLCAAAVDALHARLEGEARAWRSLQLGASKADGLLEVRGVLPFGRRQPLLPHCRARIAPPAVGVCALSACPVSRPPRCGIQAQACSSLCLPARQSAPCVPPPYVYRAYNWTTPNIPWRDCRPLCSGWTRWSTASCRRCRRSGRRRPAGACVGVCEGGSRPSHSPALAGGCTTGTGGGTGGNTGGPRSASPRGL